MQRHRRTSWIRLALIEVGVLAIGAALIVALALGLDDTTRALLPFVAH
jgi:hypothetical protein